MLSRRRSLLPVLVGTGIGLLVAVALWVVLFAQPVEIAPNRYPTFEAARPVAVEAAGRHRWPGTSVRLTEIDSQSVRVERRWLGMRESSVTVQETAAGWDIASPEAGSGHAVQVLLGALVPGALAGGMTYVALRRWPRGERSGPDRAHTAGTGRLPRSQ